MGRRKLVIEERLKRRVNADIRSLPGPVRPVVKKLIGLCFITLGIACIILIPVPDPLDFIFLGLGLYFLLH